MLSLALALSAKSAHAEVSPIITTDLVQGTSELLYDIYAMAWEKSQMGGIVAQAMASLPIADIKKQVNAQLAALPPDVHKYLDLAQEKTAEAKSMATDIAVKAKATADLGAATAIDAFERALPAYKGLIPKTFGNLVLFGVYMGIVLAVLQRVVFFCFRLGMSVLWFFCFCGCCCCRSGKAKNGAAPAKGKAKAKAKGAPAKSETTAPKAAAAAPPKAGTKKSK